MRVRVSMSMSYCTLFKPTSFAMPCLFICQANNEVEDLKREKTSLQRNIDNLESA